LRDLQAVKKFSLFYITQRPITVFTKSNKRNWTSEPLGLWTSSIVSYSKKLETVKFRNLVQWLWLALSKRSKNVFLPSPEDGNRPSFRSVVFSSYLRFPTMKKVPVIFNVISHRQNPLDSSWNWACWVRSRVWHPVRLRYSSVGSSYVCLDLWSGCLQINLL
jgi:hypothetical protein